MASDRAWLAATLRSSVSAASLLLPRLCGGVVSDGPPELLKTEPAPSTDGAFCLVAIYLLWVSDRRKIMNKTNSFTTNKSFMQNNGRRTSSP